MYPESDELICEVPSLKVTIRLVLGLPGDSSGSNARDARAAARAARDATREQAGQQRGGHWN